MKIPMIRRIACHKALKEAGAGMLLMIIQGAVLAGGPPLQTLYTKLGLPQNLQYRAEMHMTHEMNGKVLNTVVQVAYKEGHIRTEGELDGQTFITIVRTDGRLYSYNGAMDTWIDARLEAGEGPGEPEVVYVGEELLDENPCRKYLLRDTSNMQEGHVWVSGGMVIMIKMKSPQGVSKLRYHNIQKDDVPDHLFLPPEGVIMEDMGELAISSGAGL